MSTLYGTHASYLEMTVIDRLQFLRRLRAIRENDLSQPSTYVKKRQDRKTVADKVAEVTTQEERDLCTRMGWSLKDLKKALL